METAVKGFYKGLNRDAAKNKYDPNTYEYASNWRIITGEGMSTGSLENEKGTLLSFKVPDVPEITLEDGTVIPQQMDVKIIGLGVILDTIIVITTNETSENPVGSVGQLWKCKFDESTGKIIDLDVNGYLTITDHLVYARIPNLSTYHTVKRIIGRYENISTQRVYWTDNYNPVRTINVVSPNVMNMAPGLLDLATDTILSQPVPVSIGSGSLPSGTVVQFAYRLLSADGAESLYSPCSVLYPLSKSNIYTDAYNEFDGDGDYNVDFDKSVTYYIKDIDTRFKYIEHVVIIYTRPNIYTIYKFDEQLIPSAGELTVVCGSIANSTIINPVEFNVLSSGFDIAKDIEVKNRRLIAANTKTKNFDLDFDARVYRFNSAQEAKIYNNDGSFILIDGTAPDYNIPENHDCINRYNDEQGIDWQQNLYQADGTTIGGSGLNISYTFVNKELPADFSGTGISVVNPHTSVDRWSNSVGPESIGVTYLDGTSKKITRASQFKNNSSAFAPAHYRGYARGEVYRFAIVFYNKKGSPSFAKWIGDIKFPEPQDGFPIQDTIGGLPYNYSLGIEFNVDISSVEDQISAFQIVRVQRTEDDKTRFGSGALMFFERKDETHSSSLIEKWYIGNTGFLPAYTISNDANIYNLLDSTGYHLNDRPGYSVIRGTLSEADRFAWLISPFGQYGDSFDSKTGDYTKTTGYYRTEAQKYHGDTLGVGDTFGFYYKSLDFISLPHAREWYELKGAKIMETGEYVPNITGSIINGLTASTLRNTSYSKHNVGNRRVPFALGSRKLLMVYTDTPSITRNDGDPAGNWDYYNDGVTDGHYYTNSFNANHENHYSYYKEILYCRPANNQYGGNTYIDRGSNIYISTGHHQSNNGSTYTFQVYGGDTFVNYFDDESMSFYNNRSSSYLDPYDDPVDYRLSIAHVVGCESSINYEYNMGKRWAADRDGTDATSMQVYDLNDFTYNLTFSQENNTELKFYAKDAVREFIEEQPHRLWASDNKIDGELVDSWRRFSSNNITEVNGVHGPINRIINYRDRLFFYQDKAFGIASIDDQSVITDESGQTMILGTGGVFPNYGYISVNTGTIHQLAVAATEGGLYHYDARLKKIYKYSEGPQPLSDIKGMSSWFSNEIQGEIRDTDLLTIDNPIGIVATPDYRYNRVLFTFLNHKPIKKLPPQGISENFFTGDIILVDGVYYEFYKNQTFIYFSGVPDISKLNVRELPNYNHGFTISYNEFTDSFESFYDYKPSLYLNNGRRLLSVSPFNNNVVYEHNVGEYCKYYDRYPYVSKLNLLFADKGLITKIFNNIAYKSEVYDIANNDVYDETFNRLRFYNEYQDTNFINLDATNIKRRMRTWHHTIPRDSKDGRSRLRNPWLNLVLEYDNLNGSRFVLHDMIYNYISSEY